MTRFDMANYEPRPAEVVKLRSRLQKKEEMGITAAQDYCAARVYTHRRSWQQWERGERRMHPAIWELARIKLGEHPTIA